MVLRAIMGLNSNVSQALLVLDYINRARLTVVTFILMTGWTMSEKCVSRDIFKSMKVNAAINTEGPFHFSSQTLYSDSLHS